jgi:surfactin synthase thioesterase subunit
VYRQWSAELPPEVELCSVELPGREARFRERPIASIPDIVGSLEPALQPLLDLPYVFFGHSMGAILAIETTRALAARGATLPSQLFVSARRPPHVPAHEPPMNGLSDAEFVAEIHGRYGAIPAAVMNQPDVLELVLPALRADIAALEMHRPAQRSPLAVPITAFGGADDALTPRAHLEAWRSETSSTFRVRVFPGGHFYLNAQRAAVLADVATTLAPLLSAVA